MSLACLLPVGADGRDFERDRCDWVEELAPKAGALAAAPKARNGAATAFWNAIECQLGPSCAVLTATVITLKAP